MDQGSRRNDRPGPRDTQHPLRSSALVLQPRWPLRLVIHLGDVLVAGAALPIVAVGWAQSTGRPVPHVLELFWWNSLIPPGLLLVAYWWAALASVGLYDPLRMITSVRILRALARAAVRVVLAGVFTHFLMADASRSLLLSWALVSTLYVGLWRLGFFRLQHYISVRGLQREGVIIVGVGSDARLMAERLQLHAPQHYVLRGFLEPSTKEARAVESLVLGDLETLPELVNQHGVGTVILASRVVDREEAMTLASRCERMGLRVLQTPVTWGLASARVMPAAVGGLELVELGGLSYTRPAEWIKRGSDFVAVILGGLLLSPLFILIAAAIKLDGPGPVLYGSRRSGRGGRAFDMYKFRTMVPDAHAQRKGLPSDADGRLFKMDKDPRITRIGSLLRRWSIDELPQLLNVVRGEMNLVGPRPLPVEDLEGIEEDPEHWYWFEQRSRVRPGITGLWQVAGRSDLPFKAMVDLDVHYIQDWSLFLDLQILLRTIPAVVRRRGAR